MMMGVPKPLLVLRVPTKVRTWQSPVIAFSYALMGEDFDVSSVERIR
jgi:hypothetical protein